MSDYTYLDALHDHSPTTDDNCQWLVDYLGYGLNYAAAAHDPNILAVRSTKSYDAVSIDVSSYPILKVYRQAQTSNDALTYRTTLIAAYAMTLPKQDELPGIMQWVATHITAMLAHLGEFDRGCGFSIDLHKPFKHEFKIMINDLAQPSYCFLRVSFEAVETRSARF